MSSIDLSESLDSFYEGKQLSTEKLQVLVPILRQLERGNDLQTIAENSGFELQQVEALALRRRGWELSRKYKLC